MAPWPPPTQVSYLATLLCDLGKTPTVRYWAEWKPWPPPREIGTTHILVNQWASAKLWTFLTWTSPVAQKWAAELKVKIRLEDVEFDWITLDPDVQEVDYITWVCSQDSYACIGQKCYVQPILFMHNNWFSSGMLDLNSKQYMCRMLLTLHGTKSMIHFANRKYFLQGKAFTIIDPMELMQAQLVQLVWDLDAQMVQISSYLLQPADYQFNTLDEGRMHYIM